MCRVVATEAVSCRSKRTRSRIDRAINGKQIPGSPPIHDHIPPHAKIALVEVDDPCSPAGQTDRTLAPASMRDILHYMHARRQINGAQFLAGRRWEKAYEQSQIGSLKSPDLDGLVVSGGKRPEPPVDLIHKARNYLARASRALGRKLDELVHDVLGSGLTIEQVAALRGSSSERAVAYLSYAFRELALETLAEEYGLASEPHAQGRPREAA